MAMDKTLKAKLDAAKKNWGKARTRAAENPAGGFDELPDGRYLARLTGGEMGQSKSSGRLQVAWTYKIMDGAAKGKTKMDFDGLETEDNLMFLARKINRYGYEAPDDLNDVEALLAEIVKGKPLVKIRLKSKGEFQNVYIDNVINAEDEEEALSEAAEEGAAGDDDTEGEAEAEDTTADDDEVVEDSDATEEDAVAEEEDIEGDTLVVGMEVMAPFEGKMQKGTVLEIVEDEDKVRVKLDSGKLIRVKTDKLESVPDDVAGTVEDSEEEVPEAPVAPKAKKTAAAPAAPAKKGKK